MTPLDSLVGYLINPGIPNAEAAVLSLSGITADTIQPFLVMNTSYVGENICVNISAFDAGGSGIRKVRYVYGSKPADFFASDSGSSAVLDETLYLTKAGYYTFYVEDYAGNYQLYNSYIEDDTLVPDFTASYHVAPDYSYITVYFSASDADSGVKTIKYLAGEFTSDAFLFAGENLNPDSGQHTLYFASDVSAVTFYMADYRGNTTTCVIHPEIIPATSLYLNVTERSLEYMETFRLQPLIFPWLSTDGVTYTSMNDSVLIVDNYGLVTAIGPGEAYIKVTTHSGVSAVCKFIVASGYSDVQIPEEPEDTTSATGSAINYPE